MRPRHQPHRVGSKPPIRCDERSRRPPRRVCTTPTKAALGSVKALSKLARAGVNPDSRALLRPSVRSPLRAVRPQKKPMLSWPSPLRGFPDWPLGSRPPLPCFSRGPGCLPKKAPSAVRRHLRVSIRTSPGDDSEEPSQPPWGSPPRPIASRSPSNPCQQADKGCLERSCKPGIEPASGSALAEASTCLAVLLGFAALRPVRPGSQGR